MNGGPSRLNGSVAGSFPVSCLHLGYNVPEVGKGHSLIRYIHYNNISPKQWVTYY